MQQILRPTTLSEILSKLIIDLNVQSRIPSTIFSTLRDVAWRVQGRLGTPAGVCCVTVTPIGRLIYLPVTKEDGYNLSSVPRLP